MPIQVRVENVSDLAHGTARTFEFERAGETQQGFLMAHGETWVAYLNRCPHWGVDLDFGEGRFFAPKVDRIVCRNHGALFVPATGFCDSGPCAMESLQRFGVTRDGADALVEIPDEPPDWAQ